MVDESCKYSEQSLDDGIVYTACTASCRWDGRGLAPECDSDDNLKCEWVLIQRKKEANDGS